MDHLLQKSKCSIFHNIFKYVIFQRGQISLLWSKGLIVLILPRKKEIQIFREQVLKVTFSLSPESSGVSLP